MTTYSYSITVDDSEVIAVETALYMYLQHCEEQLSNGPCAPYWAHKQNVERVLGRLHSDVAMTSMSSISGRPR